MRYNFVKKNPYFRNKKQNFWFIFLKKIQQLNNMTNMEESVFQQQLIIIYKDMWKLQLWMETKTCQSFDLVPERAAAVAGIHHNAAPDPRAELTPAVRQPPVGGVRSLHDRRNKGHTDHSHLSRKQQGHRHLPPILWRQVEVPPHEH